MTDPKICPSCGEKNNSALAVCWKCGIDFSTGQMSTLPQKNEMSVTGEWKMFVLAAVFFLFSCFLLIFVLGGAMSTLAPDETPTQRILGTITLFIVAMVYAVSGFGALLRKPWARIGGIIAALAGVVWFVFHGLTYEDGITGFLITLTVISLSLVCFLSLPKVKEWFQ